MARYYGVPLHLRLRARAGRSGRGAIAAAVAAAALLAGAAVMPHAVHAAPGRPAVADAVLAGNTADLGPAASEQLANQLATARGWGGQVGCLDDLWTRESGFQRLAINPSGAFGEAQALGHDPSGAAAAIVPVVYYSDGETAANMTVDQYPSRAANAGDAGAQVAWGLGYIAGTYGSPCGAWRHETDKGWY
jgi:hypothetical protein